MLKGYYWEITSILTFKWKINLKIGIMIIINSEENAG